LPGSIVKVQQAEVVCDATVIVKSHPAVNCAIYTRHCPADREAERKSHQEQRDACMAFVSSQREHGWRALRTRYIDSDSSMPTMQRSSLRRLIEHIQTSIVHVVVVYRLEHLSANLAELAEIVEVLQQHNAALVSLSQQLNTSEPAGRLAVSLLLSFARFESKLNTDPQAKLAPVTPPRLSLWGKPAEYEKFLQNSPHASSESRHTIRTELLLLGPGRKKAFLTWARKGFGFRKPAASQRQTADSTKTA
jgi:DNA invertase Pin-like site-specific DNA recombinase